jgi:hypothetical protein
MLDDSGGWRRVTGLRWRAGLPEGVQEARWHCPATGAYEWREAERRPDRGRRMRRFWSRLVCVFRDHLWDFRPQQEPPVVVCLRCGRWIPMP